MALARLYVITGEKKYLEEAKFLLDYRGKTGRKDVYSQSDKPVINQTEAWGHAVRAGYMYAGMADVAALLGDTSYIKAIDTIYNYSRGAIPVIELKHRLSKRALEYLLKYLDGCDAVIISFDFSKLLN